MKRVLFFLMAIIFAIESIGQVTIFPWTENFDSTWSTNSTGNVSAPQNWININGGNSNYSWKKNTVQSRIKSGTGSAELFAGNGYVSTSTTIHSDWLISPLLSLNGNQKLKFYISSYASYYGYYTQDLGIYIYNATSNGHDVLSISDTSLFTPILPTSIIEENIIPTWIEYEINLSNYSGNYRIAFVRNNLKGGAYIDIDELSIDNIPSCSHPFNLNISNIQTNSVNISFSPANSTDNQWRIYYKPLSSINWDSIDVLSSQTSLTGLLPNTAYQCYIRNICGTTLSDSSLIKEFRTSCSTLSNFPFYEDFDSYIAGSGYTLIPFCWTKNNINNNGPYINTGGFTNNCLYFYSNSGLIISIPQIDTSHAINSLMMKFKYKNYQFTDRLLIGTMTNPLDSSSFVVYDTIKNDIIGVWDEKEIYFNNYQGVASNIAFKVDYGYAYLDNIEIIKIPQCSSPANIKINQITSNSVNINFIPVDINQTNWYIYYKTNNDTIYDSIPIYTTSYVINGLIPNTDYSCYIKSFCATEMSNESLVVNFKTSCYGIQTLPYTESFDNYGTGTNSYPNCWLRNSTSENSPYINSTNYSSPGALYFNTTTNSNRSLAIVTPVDSNIQMNNLRVKFKMYSSNLNSIQVGIMDDPSDLNTFIPVGSLQSNINKSVWEDKEVIFDTYNGNGRYIALLMNSASYQNISIDNFEISNIPSCAKPKDILVTNITSSSAEVSWTEGHVGDIIWYFYYKRSNDIIWDSIIVISNPNISLTNLDGSTTYEYYLKTDCSTEISEPTIINTFKTNCGTITKFPWIEDFEQTWPTDTLSPGNELSPYCWINFNASTTSGKWTITTTSSYVNNGKASLQMFTASFSNIEHNDIICTPIIKLTGNETLRFWAKGYSTYNDTLEVKIFNTTILQRDIIQSDTNQTNFITILPKTKIPSDQYNEYEIDLSSQIGDCRILFVRNSYGGYRLNIDDLSVFSTPSCKRTNKPSISNIDVTSVDISFVSGSPNDNSWYLYYINLSNNISDSILINSTTYKLQNLIPNTNYQCYIRTLCGSDLSETSLVTEFKTNCQPLTNLPYIENFDNYGTGNTAFPDCWTGFTTYLNYPYIATTNYSSPGSLYFYATNGTINTACIAIDTLNYPINTLRLKFKLRKSNLSHQGLEIGVMQSPFDTASFVKIDSSINTNATNTWEDKDIFLSSFNGNGNYLTFRAKGSGTNSSFYIDNLEITQIPQCLKPTNISVTNITNNSATFSWTPASSSDSSWWLYYKTSSAVSYDSVNVKISSLPYTLTGLSDLMNYNYYVTNNCGTEFSEPTILYNFTTLANCPAPTNLIVYNLYQNTFDLKWDILSSSTWQVEYKEKDSLVWIQQNVIVDSINISGLNAGTNYNVRIASLCNNNQDTSIFSYVNISTPCNPITTIPWAEGFESTTWLTGNSISDAIPAICWININGSSQNYRWRSTPYSSSDYVHTGNGSASLYGGNSLMSDYLMTPIITLSGNERISFWAKCNNMNVYPENVWVKAYNVNLKGDITSFTDTSLFINISSIDSTLPTTWKYYEFPLTNLVGDYRIVFGRDNNIGYYFHLDDVLIDSMPKCIKPSSLSITNIQNNQVDLSWTKGKNTDSRWQIEYRQQGTSSWTVISTNDTNYTIQNLLSNTAYEVIIYTDCFADGLSIGTSSNFRTLCNNVISVLPWSEDFDTYISGNSSFPDCWIRNTLQTDRPNIMSGGYVGNCLYYYVSGTGIYAMAILPEFDQSIPLNTLQLDFKFKSGGGANGDSLRIGVMSDTSASSWVQIESISGPTSWNDYHIDLSSYTGNGKFIAFKVESDPSFGYARAYLDNLVISTNVVCNAPTNVVANNIATTSADISWTAGGTESSWQIKEGSSGAPVDLTNNQYQATGLTPNTAYTFYVRSNCTNGVYSSWVAVNFTTDDMPTNPLVTTSPVTAYTHNTATFTGSYTEGSDIVTAIGFDYKEASASTWTNTPITPLANPFNFSATGLTPSTTYQVTAYATTSAGTFYGDTVTFMTDPLLPPTVTTDTVIMNTTNFSAVFQGTTSQGTDAIIARGFEYKLLADAWTSAIDLTASGSANITATATGLAGVKYQVRAYAETLEGGKTYGDILDFNMSTSINSIDTDNLNVNLYPNPASSEATLSIKGINGKVKISITDVQGRTISTIERESSNGEVNHSINLEAYAKGVYYVKFNTDSHLKTVKLIVY